MSNQPLPSDCTSADLEKVALNRFRTLVSFLPSECKIFREPWDCSTVLCLDFVKCPNLLDSSRQQAHWLIKASQELGLSNAVIFKVGHKFMGWKTATPPK
jgi:hypothetical protein